MRYGETSSPPGPRLGHTAVVPDRNLDGNTRFLAVRGVGVGQGIAEPFGHTPVPFAILGVCGYLGEVTQSLLQLMISAAVGTALPK